MTSPAVQALLDRADALEALAATIPRKAPRDEARIRALTYRSAARIVEATEQGALP